MLKKLKKLLKSTLISNLALGLIVLPQSNLLIPQTKLDTAFDIQPQAQTQDQAQQFQIPLNFIYMSQGFTSFHPGIDLAALYGTPIKPIAPGTVEEAGFVSDGYGNMVLLDNGNSIESLYAHLSQIEVKKGQTIDVTTEIGKVGITGHSTGPHLHLEIHQNKKPVNPLTLLPPLAQKNQAEEISSLQQ